MENILNKKTAVVYGAGSIGGAVAVAFARASVKKWREGLAELRSGGKRTAHGARITFHALSHVVEVGSPSLRYLAGGIPTSRLKAWRKATSDS